MIKRGVVLVGVLLVVMACGGKGKAGGGGTMPPGGDGGGGGAIAGGEKKWVYAGEVMQGEEADGAPVEITLVESARREEAGVKVIELSVWKDGAPLTEEGLEGMQGAPFDTFGTKVVMIVGRQGDAPAVWMVFTKGEALDAAMIKEVMSELPTWTIAEAARAPRPEIDATPEDQVFQFADKVGAGGWVSYCTGFVHPSPESGDFFMSERCFEPSVGITRLVFESVWGGYELELKAGPSGGWAL